MQRYFKDTKENIYSLSTEDSHHILKVMRMTINDEIEVVNNEVLYIAKIINTNNDIITVENIKESTEHNELPLSITLVQAAVKEQKLDYILQKSCELGISDIKVLNSKRSIVKLDKKEDKKINRWNKILKEASEQSKRNKVPTVSNILDIKDLIKLDYDIKLLCTVNEKVKSIKKLLSNININDRIIFVVGPEGGFSPDEEELMINNGFIPTTLGDRVLRTETVSSFVLSCINYETME